MQMEQDEKDENGGRDDASLGKRRIKCRCFSILFRYGEGPIQFLAFECMRKYWGVLGRYWEKGNVVSLFFSFLTILLMWSDFIGCVSVNKRYNVLEKKDLLSNGT
ncbi:hypothetical protein CEXT_379441 [Caerostris extrusa]|uniref:Uncharacterized protein n=1 Tax=Caerostris extrusa TaxID=172846 RepID=A0AAV4XGX8_CAEEX|nr:hypothetical protein CEXT_379441 [Caerostris extrusa]